jgi:sigma-B regulation protein RsbQ
VTQQFARVTFLSDHRPDYGRVVTPTLLVECAEDALAPPQVGEWVQAAIPGSRRVVLDAAGHCPHMSAPDAVIAAISEVLSDLRRAA